MWSCVTQSFHPNVFKVLFRASVDWKIRRQQAFKIPQPLLYAHSGMRSYWDRTGWKRNGHKGVFYEFFLYGFLLAMKEKAQAKIGIHPFLGLLMGNRDELSHFSYSWVALDVISTPYLLPFSHPGCCEPNPLLSSVVGAQWGKARPRGTQQCVSRVRGLAPLFPRRWNTSSSQGGESGRGERIPPWNCCTVFFIRSWLNNQEIKSQKELNSHSLVCMVELLRFNLLMNTFMFSVIVYECFDVMFCFFKTKMTLPFNQSQR